MTTAGKTNIPGDPRTLLTVAALVAATPALIEMDRLLPEELQTSLASLVAEMLMTYMIGMEEVAPLVQASTLLLRGITSQAFRYRTCTWMRQKALQKQL